MKYVHVDCLQEWMKNRLDLKVNGSAVAYLWRRMDCELCKEILPTTISYGDEAPVAPNNTKAGRAQNRRVVMVVLA